MGPWHLLLEIIGWSLVGLVVLIVLLIGWAFIVSIPKSIRDTRRRRSQTIFKSPDK